MGRGGPSECGDLKRAEREKDLFVRKEHFPCPPRASPLSRPGEIQYFKKWRSQKAFAATRFLEARRPGHATPHAQPERLDPKTHMFPYEPPGLPLPFEEIVKVP